MKSALLIAASAAALVAGVGLASAQGINERREAPAAAAPPVVQPDHQKSTAPQKPVKATPAPTAQAPEKAKPVPSAQAPQPVPSAQAPKPAPTAQAPKPAPAAPAPAAQAPEKATGSNHETVGQSPSQGAGPSAATQGGSKSGATVPLSTEQHAKFRETLRGEKAERLANVQFSISVGETVPRTVHLYRLPTRIVEYAPQYRDYDYILVGDDILIVDPRTHRIVAVISA